MLPATLAIILVLVGMAGAVVPGLPGPILVLAGLVWLAWLDGFAHAGTGTVAILVVLTAACYVVDFGATALGASRAGAGRWAIVGAVAGTVVGLFFGLPGLIMGPFLGAVAGEYVSRRSLAQATRAGFGTWVGLVVGTAVKVALVLSMVGIMVAAFLAR